MNRQNGTRATRSRLSIYLVYALFPFALIGILEGILRLTDVGDRIPLFVPAPTAGYMQPNEAVIKRLFFRPSEAPAVHMEPTYFLGDKPKDGIRIVVQGASSAAGFPFGRAASLAMMLQQRLEYDYAEREVEVISTALPAINSFALLNFADEIVDIKPDAVMIYAGHNEFLGFLGVDSGLGSDLSPQLTRLVLDLRKLHLVEAGFQAYGAGASPRRETEGALMSQLGRHSSVPFGSEVFNAGHRQFSENLALLLDAYQAAGIPVFIGTLAAREKGLPPFRPADLSMSVASSWNEARKAFSKAVKSGNAARATLQSGLLVKLAPDNAMSWYLTGQAELMRDRPAEARHAFLKAKDLDQLRFRAPESFNDIIRSAALEHQATLVDVQQALAIRSPARIIGGETMLDHVHPDADGYFFIAEAFYKAIIGSGILAPPAARGDQALARSEMPVTEVDRLYGKWRIARLLHDWPFVERDQSYSPPQPTSAVPRIAMALYEGRYSWSEAMDRALAYYRNAGKQAETTKYATSLAMAVPFGPENAHLAGSGLLASGRPDRALAFLRQAVTLRPDETGYLMSLAECYAALGRPRDALTAVGRVLQIDADNAEAAALGTRIRETMDKGR